MKVITISAKAQHGKDYTAKLIRAELERYGYKVLVCHYADLLKYICKQFFGWNGEKDEAGRTLLQKVGTEGVRVNRPDFWVDFISDILKLFPDEWDFVLIPDTRFPNEILKIKECFNVTSVHITRPNFENSLTEEQRKHPSETALDDFDFDYELINNGTEEGMKQEVLEFIETLFQKDIKRDLINKVKEQL